ncbi:hypothetical protein GH5_00088 [Leishmania sp. Ghana 2012 LV757]|uniref:hypothetical protein n=1 Tax=Leishmania sp. Ghana 2012 LV757 TaxID=2803181 RepID=UPI001B43ECD3|nr:hypothetical protein GH5_00088 [Leishmania sp. Ghana 2012 LV757]
MKQDEPRPLLRFARQWTLPSEPVSNAGAAILDYPSRHAESLSPLRRSWAPVTPSPDKAGRRQPLEAPIASGSPFPSPPSELSALTFHGAARHVDASPQVTPCPAPMVASGRVVAEQSVPAVLLANDEDGKSFWRLQAQRLEAKCAALKDELSAVYRFLAQDAAGIHRAQAGSSHNCLTAAESAIPTYEAVVHERHVARLELAREREKSFLLRHRLREMEAEVHRLQRAHDRNTSKQCAGAALKRASSPSISATSLKVGHSRDRRSDSRPCSSSRSSAQSTRCARRSPTYPPHRSRTRQGASPSVRREESLRPVPEALSKSSARCSNNHAGTRSSIASVSSSTHCGTLRRAVTASAAVSAAFAQPQAHSAHSPSKPTRQAPRDYEAEARDLLTSLLGMRSSPPNQLPPAVGRRGATESVSPGPVGSPTLKSLHRRVFQSDIFSTGSEVGEESEGGRRPARGRAWGSADTRAALRDRRLLRRTPPQRVSGTDNDAHATDPSTGAAHSFREIPLVMRATRSSVDAAREDLSGKGAFSRFAEDAEWTVWPPYSCGARQRPGGA